MRLELPSKSPTVGLNWARAIFMSGGQGMQDTSCFSSSISDAVGEQFVKSRCVAYGALKCAATKSNRTAEPRNCGSGHRMPCPYNGNRKVKGACLHGRYKFDVNINNSSAGESPALRTATRGQKKLPKDFPSGAYACPRMREAQIGRSADAGAACAIRR